MGNMVDRLEDPITDKETDIGEANGLRYGVSCMQGWRTGMEDSHNIEGCLPGLPNVSFFGVYDGHGGKFTADYTGKNMVRIITSLPDYYAYLKMNQEERDDVPGVKVLKKLLNGTFLAIDQELRTCDRPASPRSQRERDNEIRQGNGTESVVKREKRSGSTCVVVVITPKHFVCANAGDSRACFSRNGKAYPLSFDHKPTNASESSRVEKAGGTVTMRRIDGDLAVSRGLGDFQYKTRVDLSPEKQKVSVIPDVTVYPREPKNDEFVVLACDGIWDVLSNEDCISMIQEMMNEGERDMGLICEEVLHQGLEKDSRDNMSIIIVTMAAAKFGYGPGVDARRSMRLRASQRQYAQDEKKEEAH